MAGKKERSREKTSSSSSSFSSVGFSGIGGFHGKAADAFMRIAAGMTLQCWTSLFAALPILQGKNLLWLQLLLIDKDQVIQEKFQALKSRVAPNDSDVVECSREIFREAAPFLLLDGGAEHWVFSRSLVLVDFDGSVEPARNFSKYDPVTSTVEAMLEDVPSGVCCSEVYLFLAGVYAVKEGGFSSRDEIINLLRELDTEEGNGKILGFSVCSASVKVSKKKLSELKGVHIKAP